MDLRRTIVAIAVALGYLAGTTPLATGAAEAAGQAVDAGFRVDGVLAEYTVDPGQVITHKMVVSLGSQANSLDVQVDARGLGQQPDGSVVPLEAASDRSQYSARQFIQKIDPPSFHLDPGTAQTVVATMMVPQGTTKSWRYADVYIHSLPTGSGHIGTVVATNVPVLLELAGSQPVETGKITQLTVDPVVGGHPIAVSTTLNNTGNHHYKAKATVELLDPTGQTFARQDFPLTDFSIVPTFARQFKASFSLLDKLSGLAPGTYTAQSSVLNAAGGVIDSQKTTFQVGAEYQPFPGMDPASVVVTTFNGEACHDVDARAKADVVLKFRDCPPTVTGTVVIGKFASEPASQPGLSVSPDQGGLGLKGVKWVGIGVAGFSQGTGIVDLYYHDDEIKGFNPTEFILGALFHQKWASLANIGLFNNDQYVQGEIPVSTLNGNPIIALGGGAIPSAVQGKAVSGNFPIPNIPIEYAVAGGGALLLVVAGGVAVLAGRRRRRRPVPRKTTAVGPYRSGGTLARK
jgi:hypothetical protein